MKYTRIIKLFVFFGLIFSLMSCNSSLTKSVIYRLEDSGYDVEPIDFDEVDRVEPEFEVVGAKKVYEIYDQMDNLIAYLYEFDSEAEIEELFDDLELDILEYEDQIYENLLVVPYENIDYINQILIIIKR